MKKRLIITLICFCSFVVTASADFVTNGDGTVTDTDTGLIWQQTTVGSMTWIEALAYCESLQLADHDDWRLPNRNELQSIVDYDSSDPTINTEAFPDTVSENYWTSTTYADNTLAAWYVNFYLGDVNSDSKESSFYVRAVRGGQ